MPTLSPARRTVRKPRAVRDRTRIGRAARMKSGLTLGDARAREARARLPFGFALARAAETYALAVRSLDEFGEYLSAVRARLQHAGYL
jgi:hypothetical protein